MYCSNRDISFYSRSSNITIITTNVIVAPFLARSENDSFHDGVLHRNSSEWVAGPVLGEESHGDGGDQWPPLHLSGGDCCHWPRPALHSDLLLSRVVLGGGLGHPPSLHR